MIRIRGARQNNLANIDVALPRGRLTVVTGVSGSGKSSLAFDTLYAEGQRRYVESFSTYARQFLERMDRPDVDGIDGLLPAVALEQKNAIRSSRSTLGTLTEVNDYLKALFAKLATLHCDICDQPVEPDLPGRIAEDLVATHTGQRLLVSFPFRAGHGEDAVISRAYLVREGYHRLIAPDGAIVRIDSDASLTTVADTARTLAAASATPPSAAKSAPRASGQRASQKADSDAAAGLVHVLVDRLAAREVERPRLVEALEAAYRMGHGEAALHLEQPDGAFVLRDLHLDRRHCGVGYPEPTEGTFSFNSPIGACEACKGFGRVMSIDIDRVIPNRRLSLALGAITPWDGPKRAAERRWLREACAAAGVPLDVPFEDLTAEQQRFVLDGDGGTKRSSYTGVHGWFDWLERKSYKMHVRVFLSRYRAYLPCGACGGTRFKPEARRFRLGGLTVAQVLALTVRRARAWLAALPVTATGDALAPVTAQLGDRLRYLEEVGVGYLTLDRQARTLSGGEVQRANLTSALGSGLVNTLFVLDEPTIGLHPADSERLARVLAQLTAKDNTVVLVEHDPDMLRVADHVIELGPGPGAGGGRVVFAGPPEALSRDATSATAIALSQRRLPRAASHNDCRALPAVEIVGARANNLRGVDVRLPFGKLTVITGVSGSGKSTLLDHVLYRGWLRRRGRVTEPPGAHDRIDGLGAIDDVVWIDQTPPGASSRANPATYVKAWDGVRTLFARQPLARERGYNPGTFSFNAGNGRCPACEGAGTERVEMQFLADVFLRCELCEGKRFKPEVLEVSWQGKSVADVLELTIDEGAALFGPRSVAGKRLVPLQRVGLGYLRLGQALNTLSGGEAQRLKLAQHLDARASHTLFLLDEPTTGLHLADVDRLVANLHQLTRAGHTVVVIEHHLDVIAAADHVIDLGPDGGDSGGELVFAGPPAALAAADTATGAHLRRWLAGIAPLDRSDGLGERAGPAYDARGDGVITIEGARVHNLKGVDVRLPRGGRTVISGVSGSGKSSLAFDIVFAEGQRRFLDCLSAYARQYITQLGRPDADRIDGIPPTVAIEQRTTRGGSRSNVANVTEIEPFLRLLYARLGEVRAEGVAGRLTARALAEQLRLTAGSRPVVVTAPVVQQRQGLHKKVFANAASLGLRVMVDGTERAASPPPRLRTRRHHDVELIVGEAHPAESARLVALIARAAELGAGQVKIPGADGGPARLYEVQDPGARRRTVLDPRYFSARTALGACPTCSGAGEDDGGRPCAACEGSGLGPIGRSIELGGASIPELLRMTAPELVTFLAGLALDGRGRAIAEGPLKAIDERAAFLAEVGLGYLTLERRVPTLSGGEAQRIRLAAQLGAHLSGVLYVLDEPTIGLHPTDTEVLLRTLDVLQARGNGIILVEHDEATLRTADVLVDMGPGAGVEGGEVLAAGSLAEVLANPRSITGRCLRAPRPPVRSAPRPVDGVPFLALRGVTHNNLRGVDVRLPRGRLTVVTGVSGSGKSSLVEVLTRAVAPDAAAESHTMGGTWRAASGFEGLERVVEIDDKPIGKNPRSTPATYVKVWDPIRTLFARLPEAKVRGWAPGRFSFNVKGGRCEACEGNGLVKLEMSFLPDAWVACDACGGRRFSRQTLQVTWDGLSIHDVLELPVRRALAVFARVPQVQRRLQLMDDVGLGYLALGQPSPTLSGGEAQRIKLVSELVGRGQPNLVVVLDEPSIGLHMADIPKLMEVVHRLVDAGATVLVIEHNPDVMREADWIIDLGPGAGADGGRVVYQGPFSGLAAVRESRTGAWLARNPAA